MYTASPRVRQFRAPCTIIESIFMLLGLHRDTFRSLSILVLIFGIFI